MTAPVAGGRDLGVPGDGVRLAATRWHGSGVPVVLLHGLASQRRYWNPVVRRLAGLPIVALDARGHGESERPEKGYDPSTVAGDVCVALDALGLSRAVVVGHSWGAMVALTLAAERPERVLAVVTVDGGLGSPAEHLPRARAREELTPPRVEVPPERLPEVVAAGRDWWHDEATEATLPIYQTGADGLARPRLPFERHMDIVDTILDHDYEGLLRRVRGPAWLIVAEPEDEGFAESRRRHVARARALLPDARLVLLRGADHDVPLQWPDLVTGVVRTAVTEVGSR